MRTRSAQIAVGAALVLGLLGQHGWLFMAGVAGIAAFWLVGRINRAVPVIDSPTIPTITQSRADSSSERAQAAYRRLLVMARGDNALAERLIQYEARRAPHDGRVVHIESAIERWVRDNR